MSDLAQEAGTSQATAPNAAGEAAAALSSLTMSRIDALPSPRFPRRFGTRVFAYVMTLALVSSVGTVGLFYLSSRGFIDYQQGRRARTLVKSLADQAELGAYAGDATLCELALSRTAAEDEVLFAAIYDRRGREIVHAPAGAAMPAPPPELLARLGMAVDQPDLAFAGRDVPDLLSEYYAPIITLTRDPAVAVAAGPGGPPPRREVVGLARLGLSKRQSVHEQRGYMLRAGSVLGASILLLGIAAAFLISRRVSRPIRALIRGAEALRAGDLEARVRIGSRDELGQLAHAFNRMARRLNESITALEDQSRDLEVEVGRRTAEVQRAADFAALLNAPLGRRDAVVPHADGALAAGPLDDGLATLLEQTLGALVTATGARAAGTYLVDEEDDESPRRLVLAHARGAPPEAFAPTPPIEFLEMNVPYVERSGDGLRLIAPLLLGTEVLGAIVIAGAEAREDVLRFAGQASAQLAIAIANVRAYAAADRLAGALTERNGALARQRDQLQEMNRLKSEFLANVSHELRTPLNAIIGYCELIVDGMYGDVSDDQKTALFGIDESGKNLLSLINQILDLAKVEAGRMTVHIEEIDVDQLGRAVVTEAAGLAKDRPYRIGLFAGQGVRIKTDGAKVKQIMTNLVSNAVKFTLSGHVDVKVRAEPDGGCTLAVADTGIGLKPEDMEIIFEEFRQVDGSYTRQFGGTGLGLAIAKRFAVLLGGTITVESALGVGSTFYLRLPKEPPAAAPRLARPTLPPLALNSALRAASATRGAPSAASNDTAA